MVYFSHPGSALLLVLDVGSGDNQIGEVSGNSIHKFLLATGNSDGLEEVLSDICVAVV